MSDAPRLRRKLPDIPDPLYKPAGHRITIRGVSRIYLDDIERAYAVMESFVPFSTTAETYREIYESQNARYQRDVALARVQNDDARLAEFVEPKPPKPIQIETSEYEPAYSLESLASIPEKQSSSLTMSINYGDLRLRCTASDCDVSTNDSSDEARKAYLSLVAIVQSRVNHIAAFMLSYKPIILIPIITFATLPIYLYTRAPLFSWAPVLAPFLIMLVVLWQLTVWGRRKGVVVLRYRHESPTLWEEYRKSILIPVFVTVVSAMVIAILYRLATGAWPNSPP